MATESVYRVFRTSQLQRRIIERRSQALAPAEATQAAEVLQNVLRASVPGFDEA
jgi:hypothetical protein